MIAHRKLWALFALLSCSALLSTSIGYHYLLKGSFTTGFQQGLRHVKRQLPSDCFNHSELCQLRFTIQDEHHFGIALPGENVFDFSALWYLKNSYIAQGVDLHKAFSNTGDMRKALEIYQVNEYGFEAVKKVIDKVKARPGRCKGGDETDYTYSCRLVERSDKDIKVICSESRLDRPTGGGATMSGLVDAVDARAVCYTADLQNGTYHLTCPVLPHLSWISIVVNYFNFSAFEYDCHAYKEHTIKNFTLQDLQPYFSRNSLKNWSKTSTKLLPCGDVSSKQSSNREHFPGRWAKISTTWYWSNGNCHYPYTISKPQIDCLNATNILLIGDSHMINKMKEMPMEYPWVDIEFRLLGLAAQLVIQLKELRKEYRLVPIEKLTTKRHVIVFNVGQWDVHFLEVFSYITYMEDVIKMIDELKRELPYPKIIWMESTPVRRPKRRGFMKTTPVLAALNDWTTSRLGAIGVESVKAFDIALPMLDQLTEDGSHFDSALGSSADNSIGMVNVEGAIVSVLFDMICQGKDSS